MEMNGHFAFWRITFFLNKHLELALSVPIYILFIMFHALISMHFQIYFIFICTIIIVASRTQIFKVGCTLKLFVTPYYKIYRLTFCYVQSYGSYTFLCNERTYIYCMSWSNAILLINTRTRLYQTMTNFNELIQSLEEY